MKTQDLILKCFAEKKDDNWQAICLDFCLAAQGESFNDVKIKLEAMICAYVNDALIGEDREYAEQLLNRRAPMRDWLKYYYYRLTGKAGAIKDGLHQIFNETIPLSPKNCHRV